MGDEPKKKNFFLKHKVLSVVLGIIVILVVLAAAGGGKNSNQATNTQTASESKTQTKESGDVTPKVGDVTKLGDREFVVNSVKRSGAFGYNTPKSGKEYVIVNVTIRNLGNNEVSYNPFDFKVQDANGAQESEAIVVLDDSLNSGTLAAGGKVTGSMPFEVPVGDDAKLIFQPSFWSSQRVVVDLGSK